MSAPSYLPINPLAAETEVTIESSVLNLEHQFFDQGWTLGHPHGQLHGLFEGRALGREKGWELWEEVGYYEGVARFWKAVLSAKGGDGGRVMTNLDTLLNLIATFPTFNDSTLSPEDTANVDMTAIITAIRSKYRTACAGLGVRPRLVAAGAKGNAGSGASEDQKTPAGMSF